MKRIHLVLFCDTLGGSCGCVANGRAAGRRTTTDLDTSAQQQKRTKVLQNVGLDAVNTPASPSIPLGALAAEQTIAEIQISRALLSKTKIGSAYY
jgi:hypothetical protein